MKSEPDKSKAIFLLPCVMLSAIILRFWGISFGLPFFMHPDEQLYLPKALKILATRDLNPHYFLQPPLFTYIYSLVMGAYFFVGKAFGVFVSASDFKKLWFLDPISFFVIARSLSALLGTATCVVLYKIGRKLSGYSVGLISCALLGFCFLHVRDSHYAVVDVTRTFFMLMSFNYMVNILLKGQSKDYIMSGIFSGLAIAAKYDMGLLVFPLLISHWFYSAKTNVRNNKKIILSMFFCVTAFLIFCPWAILDYKAFFKDFFIQAGHSNVHWFGASEESSYTQYFKTIIWGYGAVPLIFVIFGIFSLWRDKKKLILILSFPALFLLALGAKRLFFVRYAIPLIPYLCILSAYGIWAAGQHFKAKKAMISIFLLLSVLQGLIFSLRHDYLITQKDTRIIAREWIIKHIPAGSKIIIECYGPSLRDYNNDGAMPRYSVENVRSNILPKPLQEYHQEGYGYFVTSDFVRMRYLLDPEKFPRENNFYNSLSLSAEKVFESDNCLKAELFHLDDIYSPFWNIFVLSRPGPGIRIYKIK